MLRVWQCSSTTIPNRSVCAWTYACVCVCLCVIMAKLIDHQPVPICLVNTAQNRKQEKWDGKRKVSEHRKVSKDEGRKCERRKGRRDGKERWEVESEGE